MKKINLSIVIPILNEAPNLNILVEKIKTNLTNKIIYEIIFVDDNSNDNSKEIIKKIIKKNKNIKYILRTKDRDLSKSCILGFSEARSNVIAVMDGDLQHDPKDLIKMYLLQTKKDLDFVIGVRSFKKGFLKGLGLIRYLASVSLILFFFILVGKKTLDPMSGFFIFKRKIYMKNKKKLFKKGYKILADLVYLPGKNFKTTDYEINFKIRNDGKSKMNFMVLFNIIKFIIFNFIRKFLKF